MAAACWICDGPAKTGEHRVKHSDLLSIAGRRSQKKPVFFHDAKRRNLRLGTLKSDVLKFESKLCEGCNTRRTQPHDYAWQDFSEYLRGRELMPGTYIRANAIFTYDTARKMRHVHLYLAKLFGCAIMDMNAKIDTKPFARAILNDRLHPNLYFTIGAVPEGAENTIGAASDLEVDYFSHNGEPAFAAWTHQVGTLSVRLMYAADEEKRAWLESAWHPRRGSKRFKIARHEKYNADAFRRMSAK